jgi:protein-tyrosine-phosphatase
MKEKAKVLFLCKENACRSQISEALANRYGKRILEAYSAGSEPAKEINPETVEVLKEKRIDLSGRTPKGLLEIPQILWDYAVLMGCGDQCPAVNAKKRIEWDIPDPKNLPKEEFRKVFNKIESEVLILIRHIIRSN